MNGEVDVEPPCREMQYQDIRASLTTLLDLNGGNLARALEHCERLLFEAALHKAHGNQSQAARLLGITSRSVYNKIHKYQLHRKQTACVSLASIGASVRHAQMRKTFSGMLLPHMRKILSGLFD